MKNLFKPYGFVFKAGMVLLTGALIFVVIVAVFYADAYHLTTQKFKDQTANLWAITIALGMLCITVGTPTAPSNKP